jgi:hypothetical protein
MDNVISRLYETVPPEKYDHIDDRFILEFLSDEEERILATKYQYFTVNVPVIVSLMRHQGQETLPFWLEESGFRKTGETVRSESYVYDVWQKRFDSGRVELGINGFDKDRPVYFICVGPEKKDDELVISNVYPETYNVVDMQSGAFTYHDWSDLMLVDFAESL